MIEINRNLIRELDLTNVHNLGRHIFLQNASDEAVHRLLPMVDGHLHTILRTQTASTKINFEFRSRWFFPDGISYELPYLTCFDKERLSPSPLGLLRLSYGERVEGSVEHEKFTPVCRLSLAQGVLYQDSRRYGIGSIKRELVESFIHSCRELISLGWQIEARIDGEWGNQSSDDISRPYFSEMKADNQLHIYTPDFFESRFDLGFSRTLEVGHKKVKRIFRSDQPKHETELKTP